MRFFIAITLAIITLVVLHGMLVRLVEPWIADEMLHAAAWVVLGLGTCLIGWAVHKVEPRARVLEKIEGTAWMTTLIAGLMVGAAMYLLQ